MHCWLFKRRYQLKWQHLKLRDESNKLWYFNLNSICSCLGVLVIQTILGRLGMLENPVSSESVKIIPLLCVSRKWTILSCLQGEARPWQAWKGQRWPKENSERRQQQKEEGELWWLQWGKVGAVAEVAEISGVWRGRVSLEAMAMLRLVVLSARRPWARCSTGLYRISVEP